jgi:hypothetical protein
MAVQIDQDVAFIATTDHVSCDLGGETVLLSLTDGVYYGLNAVGARIWELLKQPHTVSQLRDAIVREFDVPAARCAPDVEAFVAKLRDRALLVEAQ